jgi:hypothetical protein
MFDGLNLSLGNLARLSGAKSRSLSPENFNGGKGAGGMAEEGPASDCARDLGRGWKISPFVRIAAGEVFDLADIEGPGSSQQMWMTPTGNWRFSILRIYWDGEETPSVEVPLGDFFGMGWCEYAPLNSLAICVNPGSAFNSYWQMPFRRHCRMTLENLSEEQMVLYYQINYTLTEVPEDAAYFHAQFRRSNPLAYKQDHTLVEGVRGQGHYVGTVLHWGVNNNGWWGEGEMKFYLDGDEWPTICGTGTEDYFCGSYGFQIKGIYQTFSTPYAGMHQVIRGDGEERCQQRFGLYRWHLLDPIRFEKDLRVTVQALGWRSGHRYLPLQDDIASTVFWYQSEPHAPFPALPDRDGLEVV